MDRAVLGSRVKSTVPLVRQSWRSFVPCLSPFIQLQCSRARIRACVWWRADLIAFPANLVALAFQPMVAFHARLVLYEDS